MFEKSRPARAHRIMLMRILMRMCAQVQLYDRGWPAQHRQRHAARARPREGRRWRDNKGRMAPHIVFLKTKCLRFMSKLIPDDIVWSDIMVA